ncbi:reverse transcriptase domain-containing protein [Tanacetum coccineum]|uniref:Reverse transcriptase domain-containing protein n=1 Tax=Tanacetum coccineum TaxID=301880 RepID=A0ABQ4X880_9ASTR
MRTRNSYYPNNSPVTIPRRRNRRRAPNIVEPELRTIVEVAPMADNRTMEELLQAPTEGDVANDVIKLMMFPYSLEGGAGVWVNTNSRESSSKTDERIDKLADQISTFVEIVTKKVVTPATVKAVEESCVICGGAHAYYNFTTTDSNQSSVCAATGTYNQNMLSGFFQNQASTSGTLSSNTIPNSKGEMEAITTRSGIAYEGPSIPTNLSQKKGSGNEQPRRQKDKEQTNFQEVPPHIQPPVKPHLHFDISFRGALLLMPKFATTVKKVCSTIRNKVFELAKIPLNENCSAMLLKKLPEKLGDPGKFLIPCDFSGMDVCHALADLGVSINLMPLSIWKKLSLPKLTPTQGWGGYDLELADRSITRPKGVAEDVFVKVGKFHFPTDFVVVDFDADPRVPLILGRSFLRTDRALINVCEGELILRDGDEQLIFYVNSTSKLPQKHANGSINMINFINVTCEDILHLLRLASLILRISADELALLDSFPPGNEDVDFEADLREIELLLNRDPSTDFSPKIMIDPNPERFINEPALVCLPPSGDDDDDKGCDCLL